MSISAPLKPGSSSTTVLPASDSRLTQPPAKSALLPPSSTDTKTRRELLISAESLVKTALGSNRRVSTCGVIRRTVSIKVPVKTRDDRKPSAHAPYTSSDPKHNAAFAPFTGTLVRKLSVMSKSNIDRGETAPKVVGGTRSVIQLGPTKRPTSLRGQADSTPLAARRLTAGALQPTSVSPNGVSPKEKHAAVHVTATAVAAEVPRSRKAVRPIRRSLRHQSRPLIARALPSHIEIITQASRPSSTATTSVASTPRTPATSKIPRMPRSTTQLSPITPFSTASTSATPSTISRHTAQSRTSTDILLPTPVLPRVVSRQWTGDGDISMNMIQDTSMSFIQGQEDGVWDTPIVKKMGLRGSRNAGTSSVQRQAARLSIDDRQALAVQQKYEALLEEESQRANAAEQAREEAEEQRIDEVNALRAELEAMACSVQAVEAERDSAQVAIENSKREARQQKRNEVIAAGEEAIEEERSLLLLIDNLRTIFGISNPASA